ncbi:MAG: hypothetical protein ACW99G_23605 [Candidatus Thorarchaeota archaeon]|jgi:hypothetical protein
MSVMWSYGTTKVIISEGFTTAPDPEWSYGKSIILHDLSAADTYSDGVGVDARLFKQQRPVVDGTFTSATDKTFETDIEKVITSKGF